MSCGFISHVHVENSLEETFGKGEGPSQILLGDWTTFKTPSFFFLDFPISQWENSAALPVGSFSLCCHA